MATVEDRVDADLVLDDSGSVALPLPLSQAGPGSRVLITSRHGLDRPLAPRIAVGRLKHAVRRTPKCAQQRISRGGGRAWRARLA